MATVKRALQVRNYENTLVSLDGQPVNMTINQFVAANGDTWWKEEGADGKPNLCTEMEEGVPQITADVQERTDTYNLTSVDFEVCNPCEDNFVGTRPPRY